MLVTVFRRFSQSVRISFHLSLRLLLRYRPRRVFRFGRVALPYSRGNSGPRYSVPDRPRTLSSTGLSPCIAVLSRRIRLFVQGSASGTTSPGAFARGFGSTCSGFGRPYFRNHVCFLFLPVRRCFTSGRSPSALRRRNARPCWGRAGSPIRRSADRRFHAPSRRISELVPSFFDFRAKASHGYLTAYRVTASFRFGGERRQPHTLGCSEQAG